MPILKVMERRLMKDMMPRFRRIQKANKKVTHRIELSKKNTGLLWDLTDKGKREYRKRQSSRLVEYEQSLNNLALFGVEEIPNGKPLGVEVGVPLPGREN